MSIVAQAAMVVLPQLIHRQRHDITSFRLSCLFLNYTLECTAATRTVFLWSEWLVYAIKTNATVCYGALGVCATARGSRDDRHVGGLKHPSRPVLSNRKQKKTNLIL